ncbi:retroviral aspartyl protease family protein, partial [Puccinia sorghi]
SNKNCSPCLGTQMKFETRRLTLPSSEHSSQESIEKTLPLLSISKKGLPSRITDQLALTGQRLKMLQKLINRTIELSNCYHDQIQSHKNANSTPSTSNNKDNSQYKKRFPSKPYTPSASTSAPRKENSIRRKKREGKGKEFVSCEITNDVPSLRFILFDSLNQPYRVLLDSGANMSFISLEFAKHQSLPLTDINSFPVYLVNSSKEPSFWVSNKTKWNLHISNFTSFKWDLTVLDAPGLGHDLLVYWNPDVDWQEGVINLQTNASQPTNLPPVNQDSNRLPESFIHLLLYRDKQP